MDKLRIGVIVYEESFPTEGGGHSYYHTLLRGINEFDFYPEIEIVNIVFYKHTLPKVSFKKPCVYIKGNYYYQKKVKRDGGKYQNNKSSFFFSRRNPLVDTALNFIKDKHNNRIEQVLKDNRIDLVYYLKSELNCINYPFIATHWDVAHKSMFAFPETSLNGSFEIREKYYQYTLAKAFLILCESETGRKELKNYYRLYEDKIKVFPIFAGSIIHENASQEEHRNVLEKFHLEEKMFFLYPAQFWVCKNHYNLIIAFKKFITEKNNQKIKLVLSGSDKGNLKYIQDLISSLNLEKQVVLIGFISNKELFTLYKNALALTMPTFLGPTNMPLLEAAHLQCAVLCSDLEGHREMLGDNALYFNPSNADDICVAMNQVLNESVRINLVKAGYNHIQNSPFNIEKSLIILNETLLEIMPKRKAWGIQF
jgi:glycosyltransferase involved in cell wall biosynthesis